VAGLLSAALLLLPGCGSGVEYAPVKGTVTLDEKPLVGVTVWFFPDVEKNQDVPAATGTTNDQGVYQLTSNNGKAGAAVGKHRVVVNWPPPARGTDRADLPPPLPTRYTQATDTPFQFDVKPGEQTIDLPLKAQK
jgi:hypothetical protein